jgi:hypothetical protein
MAGLPFTHDQRSYVARVRHEGGKAVAEVFNADGSSTYCSVDASDGALSDMMAQGHDDPLRSLPRPVHTLQQFLGRELIKVEAMASSWVRGLKARDHQHVV